MSSILLLLASLAPSVNDPWIPFEEARFLPAGTVSARFATTAAISGDTVVVGAESKDHSGFTNPGAAYVFTRSGATWIEEPMLIASDPANEEVFGHSVAIDGDTIAIGTPNANHSNASDAGAVYVFQRSGTAWVQQAKLIAGDVVSNATLGWSVAIHGDTIVAGAPGLFTPGFGATGAVYVYVRSGSTWTQQAKLLSIATRMGWTVSLWGDTVVAGAPEDTISIFHEGSARVFVRNGTTWSQQARLRAADDDADDAFGVSVSVHEDTVAIGAWGDNQGTGAVYLFERVGQDWSQQTKLLPNDATFSKGFGGSTFLRGDRLLAGAIGWTVNGFPLAGAIYGFVHEGGTWTQRAKIFAGDPFGDARFGDALGMDANRLVVTAPDGTNVQGRAYVIRLDPPVTFCFGDGSLPTACPCAPPDFVPAPSGGPRSGCANSFSSAGARLVAWGTVTPDKLFLEASIGGGYSGFGVMIKGDGQSAAGIASADGVRCVDGNLIRFGGHNSGQGGTPLGTWIYPNSAQTTSVTASTGQLPGQTSYYQLLYRNPAAGFCSPDTTNWSNVVQVSWP
ncbi:MAG: hypothetical protein ACKVWV_04600 [Planctomycetota bacterium]